MNNLIVNQMEMRVNDILEKLSTLPVGSEEYNEVLNSLNKLYSNLNEERKLEIELRKVDNDCINKDRENDIENRKMEIEEMKSFREYDLKQQELINERKSSRVWNTVKTIVEVGSIAAPLLCYMTYMDKGFKFEESGTYTSKTFTGLVGKLNPFK